MGGVAGADVVVVEGLTLWHFEGGEFAGGVVEVEEDVGGGGSVVVAFPGVPDLVEDGQAVHVGPDAVGGGYHVYFGVVAVVGEAGGEEEEGGYEAQEGFEVVEELHGLFVPFFLFFFF